ncbi:hypothetical protein FQN49_006375 [Arthroderma sp. PD_2]|nr:hypothetical protein FQN49_006375 [Arthroderma sp. PD_2]
MLSGQGSHFAQVNPAKKKKKGKGRHRLAPPAAKPSKDVEASQTSQVKAGVAPEVRKYSEEKVLVQKTRPLSFSRGWHSLADIPMMDPPFTFVPDTYSGPGHNEAAANGSGHARGPSDTLSTSRGSTKFAQGASSPPSPAWSVEDSKIGVHNDHSAASKAAASAAFFGKKNPPKEHVQPPPSSMRAETPRRDSTTLGAAHRMDGHGIGAFPAGVPDVPAVPGAYEDATGLAKEESVEKGTEEEEYDENEWEDAEVHDTAGAVESTKAAPGLKEENEWVKEETKETPSQTAHTTKRHSEVTEYLPEDAVGGVSGQHIERKIEKDTVREEIIEKRVDNVTAENIGKPVHKPTYAAMVAKQREKSPAPVAPVAPVAPAAPAAPITPVAPEVPPAPTPPPKVSPPPTPAAATTPAAVPVPAPIPVPLMKQEPTLPAETAEQPVAPAEQVPVPATNQEAIAATKQEVPPAQGSGLAAPAVPAKAPERVVSAEPVLPGRVPALASADDQVQAAVATSSAIKAPTADKETIRKQEEAQTSQLTHQQRKEVEKEEKVRKKQQAKEQKARDKEFKQSQKQLRQGSNPQMESGGKKLGLRQRIANRISKYLG